MVKSHPSRLVAGVPSYSTALGSMYAIDSLDALRSMPEASVNLVLTSPPYALEFKKAYGNAGKAEYIDWLRPFAVEIYRVLAADGSFVLNIGGSYERGRPTRSLYHFRVLLMLCDEIGFHLAQECFWYNPAKLPAPAEWVNVRRIRIKDSVEYVFWLSKDPFPKANNRKVLVEYSDDMRRLLQRGYRAKERPSGWNITDKFLADHGGSIPSNLLEAGNNDSNGSYMSRCKAAGIKPHPARFPAALPDFFIRLMTDPGDLVVDPFAGSNTTGRVAEDRDRKWLGFAHGRPAFRTNIKSHGTYFREAERFVGLAPEDTYTLATYKIRDANRRSAEEALPFLFAIVSSPHLATEPIADALPPSVQALLDEFTLYRGVKGVRAIENALVELLLDAGDPLTSALSERLAAAVRGAAWRVISAVKAEFLMNKLMWERVPAIAQRNFSGNRESQPNMHFSLSRDMTDLDAFLDLLRDHGIQHVATKIAYHVI